MVYVSRTCRQSPAEVLGIEDPLTAFAFNSLVAASAAEWENKRDYGRLTALIRSLYALVASVFGGDPKEFLSDDEGGEKLADDDDNLL